MPPVFDESYYRGVIHEIREMQIMNMGQYAHGNQPIQHMLYLYNYSGQPWKSQARVREAMEKLYFARPDGYCGDEDNGQTSAWYVFSAMGFYPVCPGTDQYVIGSPLFKKMSIQLENGNKLHIQAASNSKKKTYVDAIKLNGKPVMKNWFSHFDLLQGGRIEFTMSEMPNKLRGTADTAVPFSLSNE
jgi:predicted alpha-1,2-mannosidase